MRKTIVLTAAGLAALVATGLAVAHGIKATGVKAVSASFSAPTVSRAETRTCTGADGTYELTKATYTGTATSSEPALNGPIRLKVHSVYNTTTKLGTVAGELKVRDDDGRVRARFWAVNSNGTLDGFVLGNGGHGPNGLLGSLTAAWSATAGFSSGALGSGSGANLAVLAGHACAGKEAKPSVRLSVRGKVESISSSSIAVKPFDGTATQTCAITGASGSTSGIEAGDTVEMTCIKVGDTFVLAKVRERH